MISNKYVDALSSRFSFKRLDALKKLVATMEKSDDSTDAVNLQIHTNSSFSPYTPSLAAFMAYKFGIRLSGIMNNYTLDGADEFIKACKILGLTYSVGTEVRAAFPFKDFSVSDVAIFGIASRYFLTMKTGLESFKENQKNNVLATLSAVNKKMKKYDIAIDFKQDVIKKIKQNSGKVMLSKYVFFALSEKLIEKFKKENVKHFLLELGFELNADDVKLLEDVNNPYYLYDLTDILFYFRENFFPKKNYKNASEAVSLAHKNGAICAFKLVLKNTEVFSKESVSKFVKLVEGLKKLGFDAVCFDPMKFDSQLRGEFLNALKQNEMLALRLSEVEFPRQRFDSEFPDSECEKIMTNSAFAVVGSEMCENQTNDGFISLGIKTEDFDGKVNLFAKIGRGE